MAEENKSSESAPEAAKAEGGEAGKKPSEKANKPSGDAESSAAAAKKAAGAKPAADKKAKEKPPKPEDKPFQEFMEQHYLPSLKAAMAKVGVEDLSVEFAKRKLELIGQTDNEPYWQVQGQWEAAGEGQRQFNIAFIDESITGQKVFTLAANGAKPSTLEQFMGDERRITLDLMVNYTLQRLNGQKWLTRN